VWAILHDKRVTPKKGVDFNSTECHSKNPDPFSAIFELLLSKYMGIAFVTKEEIAFTLLTDKAS